VFLRGLLLGRSGLIAAAAVAEEGNVELAVGVGRGRGGIEESVVVVVGVVLVRADCGAAIGCFRRCAVRKGRS